jgi:hypothetical protein
MPTILEIAKGPEVASAIIVPPSLRIVDRIIDSLTVEQPPDAKPYDFLDSSGY